MPVGKYYPAGRSVRIAECKKAAIDMPMPALLRCKRAGEAKYRSGGTGLYCLMQLAATFEVRSSNALRRSPVSPVATIRSYETKSAKDMSFCKPSAKQVQNVAALASTFSVPAGDLDL